MEPKFLADIRHIADDTRARAAQWELLSAREWEVAERLAIGMINRDIAKQLGIGIKTVDTHRGNVLRKLGLKNNAQLARAVVGRDLFAAIAAEHERCRTAA